MNRIELNSGTLYIQTNDGAYKKVCEAWIDSADLSPAHDAESDEVYASIKSTEEVKLTGTFKMPPRMSRMLVMWGKVFRRYAAAYRLYTKMLHIYRHTKSHRIRYKADKRMLSILVEIIEIRRQMETITKESMEE